MLQQTRERQQTPEWKRSYDRRAGIEGTLSQGIRAFELRQARYRGQAKTHLHHMITAVAMNIVRIMAWLQGRPYAPTRQSPFAALRPAGETFANSISNGTETWDSESLSILNLPTIVRLTA